MVLLTALLAACAPQYVTRPRQSQPPVLPPAPDPPPRRVEEKPAKPEQPFIQQQPDAVSKERILEQKYKMGLSLEKKLKTPYKKRDVQKIVALYIEYYEGLPQGEYTISALLRASRLLCSAGQKRQADNYLAEIKRMPKYSPASDDADIAYVKNLCSKGKQQKNATKRK